MIAQKEVMDLRGDERKRPGGADGRSARAEERGTDPGRRPTFLRGGGNAGRMMNASSPHRRGRPSSMSTPSALDIDIAKDTAAWRHAVARVSQFLTPSITNSEADQLRRDGVVDKALAGVDLTAAKKSIVRARMQYLAEQLLWWEITLGPSTGRTMERTGWVDDAQMFFEQIYKLLSKRRSEAAGITLAFFQSLEGAARRTCEVSRAEAPQHGFLSRGRSVRAIATGLDAWTAVVTAHGDRRLTKKRTQAHASGLLEVGASLERSWNALTDKPLPDAFAGQRRRLERAVLEGQADLCRDHTAKRRALRL